MTKAAQLKTYLSALLTEKGIVSDIDTDMDVDGHFGLTYEMQIDFICSMPAEMIEQVRKTFVAIDFQNGDVMHFWKHLTSGMLESIGH